MAKCRRLGTRKLDPRRVTVHRTVRSESAVQGYMADPNWKGPDFFGNGGPPRRSSAQSPWRSQRSWVPASATCSQHSTADR